LENFWFQPLEYFDQRAQTVISEAGADLSESRATPTKAFGFICCDPSTLLFAEAKEKQLQLVM